MCSVVTGVTLLDIERGRVSAPTDIVIADGLIQEIVPSRGRIHAGEVIDGAGLLVLPGFVNGHTHSHEGFHRGRYPKLPLEIWMHYPRSPLPVPLTADDIYVRTLLAAIEAIRGGATTLVDDVALPGLAPEHIDAVSRAYQDAGVRAVITPSVFDLPYHASVPFMDDEMPKELSRELASAPQPDPGVLLEKLRAILRRGHPCETRVSFAVAPSAPQRCSTAFLSEVFALATSETRPIITHVQETRLQIVGAHLDYGHSWVAELATRGLLGPMLSLVHAVWLSDQDITDIVHSGTNVQHNPVSNLRLGSGLAPVSALLGRGVNLTLGTDGVSSCTTAHMSQTIRQAALLHTLRDEPPWIGAAEVLAMATSNAARALGLQDQIGRLAPGMRADLVGFRMDTAGFTPLNDVMRQLVYADDLMVDTVIVEGRTVMRRGRLTTVDEAGTRARARAAHRRLLPSIEASDRFVQEHMRPVYERVHRRSRDHVLPEEVHAARFPPAG